MLTGRTVLQVLDLGQVVAGNFCGAVLAYYGADVIKVEPPSRGDALRHLRMLDSSGTSLWWRSYVSARGCTALGTYTKTSTLPVPAPAFHARQTGAGPS